MMVFASIVAWILGIGVVLLGLVLGGLALFTAWTARRVEKAFPPQGRFVEIDGNRIHYIDTGSGPAILMVHGLAGQMHNFTHSLLDRLKSRFRVVVIDRPGSGYSTRAPNASAAIAAQAATIAKFVDALGLERPLVVGHSMGGAISLALALNHPRHVGGLALIAPATHLQDIPSPFQGLAITSPTLRWLVAWTLAIPASIKNRVLTLDTIFGPQQAPPDFATKGGGLLNLRPCSFRGASHDLLASAEDLGTMPSRYHSLTIPVGVLFGADDRILDPAVHGQALAAKLPGVDLELIEGGGHMVLIASADRSAKFIERMAQRVAGEAKPASIA